MTRSKHTIEGGVAFNLKFYFRIYGNELYCYWADGEVNCKVIDIGEDPYVLANEWKEEIFAAEQSRKVS